MADDEMPDGFGQRIERRASMVYSSCECQVYAGDKDTEALRWIIVEYAICSIPRGYPQQMLLPMRGFITPWSTPDIMPDFVLVQLLTGS